MKKKQESSNEASQTDFRCPICNNPLFFLYGSQMYPGDKNHGITLYCTHGDPNARKHPQEVSGHGTGRSEEAMIQRAFDVIQAKFCGAKLQDDGEFSDTEADTTLPQSVEIPKPTSKRKSKKQQPPVVEAEDDAL